MYYLPVNNKDIDMNDLLDLPAIALSAFKFDDSAADAAVEEIIRLGNLHLTDSERERCVDSWQLSHIRNNRTPQETRRQYAANVYALLKPLRKPLNSHDL